MLPASQLKMWRQTITDRPMRTNFFEMVRDFSGEFKQELQEVASLNIQELIHSATIDVPEEYAEWFRSIIEFRFRCIIHMEDFEHVYAEWSQRQPLQEQQNREVEELDLFDR